MYRTCSSKRLCFLAELQRSLLAESQRVADLEQELEVMSGELSAALENSRQIPSRGLRQLVEKLRKQLQDKEGQLDNLTQALEQVKTDLVQATQRTIEVRCQLKGKEKKMQ